MFKCSHHKKIIHIWYLLWPRLWIRFLFSDVRFHLAIPNQSTQTLQCNDKVFRSVQRMENYTFRQAHGLLGMFRRVPAKKLDLVHYCCSQSFSSFMGDGYKMADKMNFNCTGSRAFSWKIPTDWTCNPISACDMNAVTKRGLFLGKFPDCLWWNPMASSNSATPLPGHETTSKAATGGDGKEETLTDRSSCSIHLHSSNSSIPEIPDIPSPLLRPPTVKSAAVSASKYALHGSASLKYVIQYLINYTA